MKKINFIAICLFVSTFGLHHASFGAAADVEKEEFFVQHATVVRKAFADGLQAKLEEWNGNRQKLANFNQLLEEGRYAEIAPLMACAERSDALHAEILSLSHRVFNSLASLKDKYGDSIGGRSLLEILGVEGDYKKTTQPLATFIAYEKTAAMGLDHLSGDVFAKPSRNAEEK